MFHNKTQPRDDLLDARETIQALHLMDRSVNILKEGYLKKQSKYLQTYRKRWIVLQRNHMYCYKKKKIYKHHTEDIDLSTLTNNGLRITDINNNEFVLEIVKNTKSSLFRFIANSEHDLYEWISTIKDWIHFSKNIKIYSKIWKHEIIYNRTLRTMEFEAFNSMDSDDCSFISLYECPCAKRIVFILNFYFIWCSKQFLCSMESIFKHEFGAYNTIQLLNDYHHILRCHYTKNKTLTTNYFVSKLSACHNDNNCFIYLRNNGNRLKLQRNDLLLMIYGYNKISDIISFQILDAFHSFILHNNYDDNHTKKEEKEERISLLLQNQEKTRYSKFTTIICDNHLKNSVFGDNVSYWCCDKDYILPKFKSLKEEILNNTICSITRYQWNMLHQKSIKYKYCLFGKRLCANNIYQWNVRTDILAATPISISHIIVLLLNTNYSDLAVLFKQHIDISINIIAHFYRLLFESVYLFGDVITKRNAYYYHNLNRKPLFDCFKLKFISPVSMSTNVQLLTDIQYKEGCTLQLQSINNGTMPYFNAMILSDYIGEDEVLCFRIYLNIKDIIYLNHHNPLFMLSFKLFISMSDGGFFSHYRDLMDIKTQQLLIKMLNPDNDCQDLYEQNLFNHYLKNTKEYWMNEYELNKLDKSLYILYLSYLNKNNINRIQLFSWHLNLDKFNDTIIGPTLLYTFDSFQIAFDSLIIGNRVYFGISSIPINVFSVTVSFYLYCDENKFYAEIHDNVMSQSNKRVGIKYDLEMSKMSIHIAVKVRDVVESQIK